MSFQVFSSPPLELGGGTLKNVGSATVYYRDEMPVSSSSNDGSLAPGASVTVTGSAWVVTAAGATSACTFIPAAPVSGSTQSGSASIVATTVADAGAAETLTAPATGSANYDITLTADCAITLSGGSDGFEASLTIRLRQDATGGWDVTWPDSVQWSNQQAPLLSTEPGQYDVVVLFTTDGGTVWSGFLAGGALQAPTIPGAPTGLAADNGDGLVTLTWAAPTFTGGAAVTGYKVYRGATSGSETLLATIGNVLTYDDSTITPGNAYYYKVAAINPIGTGTQSSEIHVTNAGVAGGTVVWLKSAGLPGNGVAIDTWTNEGSLGDFTGSSTARPVARTGASNGLSAADFDGSNDFLTGPDLSGLTEVSIWAVVKFDTFSDGALWGLGTSEFSAAFPYAGELIEDAGSNTRAPNVADISTKTSPTSAYFIYEVHSKSSEYTLRSNGTSLYTGANPGSVALPAAPKIGKNGTGALFFDGRIAELRIDSVVGDAAARTVIRQEIATRHALTVT